MKRNEKCDLPDVIEFLSICRSLIRQMKLINGVQIDGPYKELINKSICKVEKAILNYKEGETSWGCAEENVTNVK